MILVEIVQHFVDRPCIAFHIYKNKSSFFHSALRNTSVGKDLHLNNYMVRPSLNTTKVTAAF